MAELNVDALDVRFGDLHALRSVTLAVADGEVVTVLGPSGSGKSTLLRAVAGLAPVAAGRIRLGGRDVTDLAPGDRDVAMVFQSYALFPHLDVAGNIGFGLTVRRTPRAERDERVRAAAQLVGCDALLGRRPDELSGGERQRVALARALVREPQAILLDEPLASLDVGLRAALRAELRALQRTVGTTTVHVTHDQVEALTLGDRVVVVDRGVVQQVGTPSELWWRPANRFVATFVGSPAMNVLPTRRIDGEWVAGPLRVPCDRLEPCGSATHAELDAAVELGVRPDHLTVRIAEGSDPGPASAVVVGVEVAGGDTWITVEATGPGVAPRLVVRVPTGEQPVAAGGVARVGAPVILEVVGDRAWLFSGAGATVARPRRAPGADP